MKKMFVITMFTAMLCVAGRDAGTVYGAVSAPVAAMQNLDGDEPLVISPNLYQDGMENPFIDCSTLKEAGRIAGFSMNVPEKMSGYGKRGISAVKNSMIQITYGSGKKALYIRKAAGDSDISGDYKQVRGEDFCKNKGPEGYTARNKRESKHCSLDKWGLFLLCLHTARCQPQTNEKDC